VRLAGAKLGAEGSAMLRELAAQPASDNVVLVLAGKLDRDVEKSAWFRALDEAGATVRAWPLRRNELPGWIGQRLRARQAVPTRWRCWPSVEGNLPPRPEIDKLALLAEPADAATLAALVSNSARYSIYDLCDRALEGVAPRQCARSPAARQAPSRPCCGRRREFPRLLRIGAPRCRRRQRAGHESRAQQALQRAVPPRPSRPAAAVAAAAEVDRCIRLDSATPGRAAGLVVRRPTVPCAVRFQMACDQRENRRLQFPMVG
jgi:hypothetical protein